MSGSRRIGVVGTGLIGTEHVKRLAREVSGATVVAVSDVDRGRAEAAAAEVGAKPYADAEELIGTADVEAVVVASPGHTHAQLVLACIAAGKPVLCEKPLASTSTDALKVVEAEVAAHEATKPHVAEREAARGELAGVLGRRRLVQVGFMRRYDPAYRQLKAVVDEGILGQPLVVHCVHRNAASPPGFTSEMVLTDSVVHEIDALRWLLGEEIVRVEVVQARPSPLAPPGLRDPQMVILHARSGAVAEVEAFVNCGYGYEVGCEVVAASGAARLGSPPALTVSRQGARATAVEPGWQQRFAEAYREELAEWVSSLPERSSTGSGPTGTTPAQSSPAQQYSAASAWDGYAAAAVAEACVASLNSGRPAEVLLGARPELYSPR